MQRWGTSREITNSLIITQPAKYTQKQLAALPSPF